MAKDKRKKRKDDQATEPQTADASKRGETSEQKKKSPSLDLDRLKNTTATQVPKSSVPSPSGVTGIGGPARTRVVSSGGPKMDWKFSIVACVSAAFLAMSAHIFCINGGLVLYDRFNLAYILSKPLMEKTSQKILMDMLGIAPLSQPWLKSSFISHFGEYGLNFSWYHVANVFSHAFTTGLVFFFVLTMARHLHHQHRLKMNPHHLACATAVLFACHPMATQSIAYLSARSSLIGTNNFFLSLNFYLWAAMVRNPLARASFTVLAFLTGAMSIWSNPECMTLPAVAVFCLFLVRRPLSNWQQTLQEHPFLAGMGLALTVLVPCLSFLGIQHTTAINLFAPTLQPLAYFGTQFKALIFYYLRCFAVPLGLSIDPPLAMADSISDPFAILGMLGLGGLIYLGFTKMKEPIFGLAGVLLLAGFLPHFVMVQPDAVADWVAYLPLSGAMIIMAYGLVWLSQRNLKNAIIILACLALLFSDLSILRDTQWASTYALWETAISLRPKSALAHASLAMEHLKRLEIDEADKEAKLAVSYNPDLALARIAQAKVLLAQGKPFEAKAVFDSALTLAETQNLSIAAKGECRLGQLHCLIAEGREKEGNALLARVFQELSGDPKIVYLVGLAAFQHKEWERAIKLFDHAVTADPTLTEGLPYLVQAAFELKSYTLAQRAANIFMNSVDCVNSRLLFARAAILTKEDAQAEDALKQVLIREAKNAKVLYLLSRMYKHRGKPDEASKYLKEATAADPEIVSKFPLPELDAEESGAAAATTGSPAASTGTDSSSSTPASPVDDGSLDLTTPAQPSGSTPAQAPETPASTPPPAQQSAASEPSGPVGPPPESIMPAQGGPESITIPAPVPKPTAKPGSQPAPAKPGAKADAKAAAKAPAKAAAKAPAKPAAKAPVKPAAKAPVKPAVKSSTKK